MIQNGLLLGELPFLNSRLASTWAVDHAMIQLNVLFSVLMMASLGRKLALVHLVLIVFSRDFQSVGSNIR
jgi:hypothetical protein